MKLIWNILICILVAFGGSVAASSLMLFITTIAYQTVDDQIAVMEAIRWPVGITGAILGTLAFLALANKRRKNSSSNKGYL